MTTGRGGVYNHTLSHSDVSTDLDTMGAEEERRGCRGAELHEVGTNLVGDVDESFPSPGPDVPAEEGKK